MRDQPEPRIESPDDDLTPGDLSLDLELALRLEGYRWVRWSRRATAEGTIGRPGRFVGHPGDLLAHLYVTSDDDAPLAEEAYARLPRYSSEPGPALRAAERAGLFAGEGVGLSCRPNGTWKVRAPGWTLEDECLPRLLSRAALRLVAESPAEGAS